MATEIELHVSDLFGMAVFGRRKPKTFEGNALASCRRLRPDVQWKRDKGNDQIVGDDITINLGELRLIWDTKDEPERPAWLEGHLSEVLYQVADPDSGRPADNEIRAMIRPRVLVESSRLQAKLDNKPVSVVPPFRSLTDDIVGLVGIDSPTSIALVSTTKAQDWNTTFDSLWETGVSSIKSLGGEAGWTQVEELVFVSETHDDYTNSRLLDPDYLDQLHLNGPAVVLLPHRNSLIVAPLINDEAVGLACELALQQLNEPSPICLKPFVYANGELQNLIVSDGHPAHRIISLLRLLDDDINYKQVVPQLAQLLGGELHIGGFFVDQDRLISSTNWGPSPTLLPKADEVVFIDDETNPLRGMVASWDAAADLFGAQLVETDYSPTRYRVDGLPDADAIRSIGQPVSSLASF